MADLFILALLGHLVGDYLLQTKRMALGKSEPGLRGMEICSEHVVLYTAAVCVFLWTVNPVVVAAVYIPHWVIDRWSLATHWLRLIRGRTFETAKGEWDVAFTALVYAVVDNTFHLLCLFAVVTLLK